MQLKSHSLERREREDVHKRVHVIRAKTRFRRQEHFFQDVHNLVIRTLFAITRELPSKL